MSKEQAIDVMLEAKLMTPAQAEVAKQKLAELAANPGPIPQID